MKFPVFLWFLVCGCNGFLLDSKNSTVIGKPTYLTVSEFYGYKSQVDHVFDQVHENQIAQKSALEQNLNLLAQQIKVKLDAFEQKLQVNTAANAQQAAITALEQKYQTLEQKYAEMRNSSDTWRQKYNNLDIKFTEVEQDNTHLHQTLDSLNHTVTMVMKENNQLFTENKRLQNLTMELQQKVVGLEHLKGVNQLQALSEVQQKTQTLDNRVTALANTQQARSQDFMALYKKVNSLEANERALNQDANQTKKDMEELRKVNNQSLYELQQHLDDQLQPVILAACHTADEYVEAGVLRFPVVKTAEGIHDLPAYQSTGKFRCTVPGYYFVLATSETWADHAIANLMVNSQSQYRHYITGTTHGHDDPASIALTLKLRKNDEVWIRLEQTYAMQTSCFNIFKI